MIVKICFSLVKRLAATLMYVYQWNCWKLYPTV